MKFSVFASLFLIGFLANAREVSITVNVPFFTPDEEIYLTGSTEELCNWNPRCLRLKKIAPQTFAVNFEARRENFQFKITRGSYALEAADSKGIHLSNFRIDTKIKNRLLLNITNWKDLGPLKVTGQLRVFNNIFSPQLNNYRKIRVWLPPNYQKNLFERYPVIYAHDGQNLFDPQTSSFGVDWGMDETISSLVKTRQIQKGFIVVGIDSHPSQRSSELDYSDLGKNYARFIIDTIKPNIDRIFRTLSGRENTYLLGSSMGAHISLSLLWRHSDIFSKAMALSLPVHAREHVLYRIFEAATPRLPISAYIDHGTVGGDKVYGTHARPFINWLVQKKRFPVNQLIYKIDPFGDHTETDWARRVYVPLIWLDQSRF